MTVLAAHKVHVVPAIRREEGRVHPLHRETAMRVGGMAGGARVLNGLVVSPMAIEAAESFMHTRRSAIIRRAMLVFRTGGMALHANPLTRVARNAHEVAVAPNTRDRQGFRRKMIPLATIEEMRLRRV